MFERFTDGAREVVVRAQHEARSLGHEWIGTEHLLVATLADPGSQLVQSLGRLGLTAEAVRAEVVREVGRGRIGGWTDDGGHDGGDREEGDAAALRDLGIDLDDVRRRVEERFGPGALDEAVRPRRRLLDRLRPAWRRPRARRCGREHRHGGHIPFTPRSKKALELALRESLRLRSKEIGAGHLILGTLGTDGLAGLLVTRLGVSTDDVRRAVLEQLGRAA